MIAWFIIGAVVLGLIPAFIARDKGESFAGWWVYGALLFIFALPHSILLTKPAARRLNVPPNWPASLSGIALPNGWKPDPAWGEPPAGWRLWSEDEPKRHASGAQWAGAIACFVVVAALAGVSVAVSRSNHASAASASGHQVTYRVTGTGTSGLIDYAVAGGQQQANGASLPWSDTEGLRALSSGASVFLSAQNADTTGSITCEIDIDGTAVVSHTSTGAYTIVTCSAPLS